MGQKSKTQNLTKLPNSIYDKTKKIKCNKTKKKSNCDKTYLIANS